MLLIISKHIDDFVNQVIDCIDEDYIRLGDQDNFSIQKIVISDPVNFIIKDQYNKIFNLNEICTIWFNGCIDPYISIPYENKTYSYLFNTFIKYKKVKKIGRLYSDYELNKLDVLLEAKKVGFLVPETNILSDKKELIDFYKKFRKKNGIVSKRIVDNQQFYYFDKYYYNFNLTFQITEEIINKMSNKFSISLFQERIVAEFEIRIVFINNVFFAMSIHDRTLAIDYRTNFDNNTLRMIPFNLPKNIIKKLKKLFKNFNLNYGSADLMYCNNKYYFLEINTTGQVSFLNNACNYFIEYEFLKIMNNEN